MAVILDTNPLSSREYNIDELQDTKENEMEFYNDGDHKKKIIIDDLEDDFLGSAREKSPVLDELRKKLENEEKEKEKLAEMTPS